jgi:hypothetical protein
VSLEFPRIPLRDRLLTRLARQHGLGRQQGALRIRGMAGAEEEKPSRPSPLRVAIKREGAGVVPVRAPDCFLE